MKRPQAHSVALISLVFGTALVFVFFAGVFKGLNCPIDWPGKHPIEAAAWITGWALLLVVSWTFAYCAWMRASELYDKGK